MFNRELADKISGGRQYVDAYFGDFFLICYEKVFEILCRRIDCDRSDARLTSAFWTDTSYNGPDGYEWSGEDGYFSAIERYLYNDSYFDTILKRFAEVLGGTVRTVAPMHDYVLQEEYEREDRTDETRRLLFAEKVKEKACEIAGLDDGFYAAIPHLDEMFRDCLMEGLDGESEWGFYALSSRKLGAFLDWKSKRKPMGRLKRAMELYESVTVPFGKEYCHRYVHDGVFYSVIFTGIEPCINEPVSVSDMRPGYLADLYLLNEEIDALNKKHKFYRKEEGYAAVSDRAA